LISAATGNSARAGPVGTGASAVHYRAAQRAIVEGSETKLMPRDDLRA